MDRFINIFLVAVLALCVSSPAMATSTDTAEPWTIVLDAGHGGKDPGAIGRNLGFFEKEYALDITRQVRDLLAARGIRVIMTRDEDVFIPLAGRARIANDASADLFVSIHINASRSPLLRGFECYYLSEATDDVARAIEVFENASLQLEDSAVAERSTGLDKTLWDLTLTENRIESSHLASRICRTVGGSCPLTNRGVKTAQFYVLKHTNMPSVLVEVCYLSNFYNEKQLEDPAFRRTVAGAIADGIVDYTAEYDRMEGYTET